MGTGRLGLSWGGLFAGPLAWAASTQINYMLVPWQCAHGVPIVPTLAVVLAIVALAGGVLSWRSGGGEAGSRPEPEARTEHFVATLGVLAAALFALVILMQGLAGLILDGCVR
jgi:hypothetical protein